jgi:hypothetical protein
MRCVPFGEYEGETMTRGAPWRIGESTDGLMHTDMGELMRKRGLLASRDKEESCRVSCQRKYHIHSLTSPFGNVAAKAEGRMM